ATFFGLTAKFIWALQNVVWWLAATTVLVRFLFTFQAGWYNGPAIARYLNGWIKGYDHILEQMGHLNIFLKLPAVLLHLPISVTKTMYGFGFERIDRLMKLMEGQKLDNLSLIEKAFNRLPAVLQFLTFPFVSTLA